MADQIAYNPFDPSFHADPYPHYRQLLAGPPRRVAIGSPVVLVARYADVVAVTRDHASFSSALPQYAVSRGGNPFGGATTLPFADPPVHTRLRRLVARDFSPRRIALLAPRIVEVTQQLLEENVGGRALRGNERARRSAAGRDNRGDVGGAERASRALVMFGAA